MRLKEFGCLLIENSRSRAYLQKLCNASLVPGVVILFKRNRISATKPSEPESTEEIITAAFKMRKYFLYDPKLKENSLISDDVTASVSQYDSFDPAEPIAETAKKNEIECIYIESGNINDKEITQALGKRQEQFIIFGGGGILKKPMLNIGKKFIHAHPGIIPHFRGSHCIEWSVLLSGKCGVTAFFMNDKIDGGDVLKCKAFDPPALGPGGIPALYSAHIRSELMVEVVGDYVAQKGFEPVGQSLDDGETFYKMHPAITNIVFEKLSANK